MELRILRGPEIKALLPMDACIALMRRTMIAVSEGRARIPLRSVVPVTNGFMGVMPGALAEPDCFGLKLLSLFPGNPAAGLSSHLGLVLLFEPEHGRPVAMMDAAEITAIRTAAASGLATDLLARADAGDLAILGAGEQAHSHLEAMLAVRPIRRVRVWSRTAAHAEAFAASQGAKWDIPIEAVADPEAAVTGADLVCTVSASREPILKGAWHAAHHASAGPQHHRAQGDFGLALGDADHGPAHQLDAGVHGQERLDLGPAQDADFHGPSLQLVARGGAAARFQMK